MTVKYQNTKRKKRVIDPKKIRKHSQIARKYKNNIIVVGNKERTETGFIIPGHKGNVIETYYEVMLPGTASALVKHEKKDRVVRILAGSGFAVLRHSGDNVEDRRIYPGDELIFKAGLTYRLCTTSNDNLEIFVSQESKYLARLETLEAATTKPVTADMLKSASPEERLGLEQTRRGSKAKEQQTTKAANRIGQSQVISPAGVDVSPGNSGTPDSVATAANVMNARPSHGRFSEDGAG